MDGLMKYNDPISLYSPYFLLRCCTSYFSTLLAILFKTTIEFEVTIMKIIWALIAGFLTGVFSCRKTHRECLHEQKELRENLSEKQIDKMVADSFPASDPPSTY